MITASPTTVAVAVGPRKMQLSVASAEDREEIYRVRHQVYAGELGQHAVNPEGRLTDALDPVNHYLVVKLGGRIAGFVSLTPPGAGSYSIDKYFRRDQLPFPVTGGLWEIRLLTILPAWRVRAPLAMLLMVAAFRWVESHGGSDIVAIGRDTALPIYLKSGMTACGLETRSGRVAYSLIRGTVAELRRSLDSNPVLTAFLERRALWLAPFPLRKPACCFHGGAFFDAVGTDFSTLERRHDIVNADVLDAWFPPAPGVLESLARDLPWLLRTSPPTDCGGLVRTIARVRGVAPRNILPGGGSSDLIFRAFLHWLTPGSRALILDPTYGEYAHVLEKVVGCRVDRLTLRPEDGFRPGAEELAAALARGYDVVVLVNPNSPTGVHLSRNLLENLLRDLPPRTRVWVDETYTEYAGPGESLERFAAASEQVIVCKSLSKVYALSGARAAYLCAGAHQLEGLRAVTPPWVVGLPAQVAATRALEDLAYYAARYQETRLLREELAAGLAALGLRILPGVANFVLAFLPEDNGGPAARDIVPACQSRGVFLRDASLMGSALGRHALRIAVKSAMDNARILAALRESLEPATFSLLRDI